jgi:deferrochelatase/peroxidase EfeB
LEKRLASYAFIAFNIHVLTFFVGTPLERSHHGDDPSVWGNPKEINKFGFTLGNRDICPFSAHIRKMNPRDDQLDFGKNFLVRAGITYGEGRYIKNE